MRPLKITPRHAITGLALAPDGRHLGVVQGPHGFKLFDTLTGAEVGRDAVPDFVSEVSPTERQSMRADRTAIRLAEVAAGRPFLRFQTGWTRTGELNRPPEVPGTSALHPIEVVATAVRLDGPAPRRFFRLIRTRAPEWVYLFDCALTADHRFVVGRRNDNEAQYSVRDLATETVVASNLDLLVARFGSGRAVTVFTPDEARVAAVTPGALLLYDLPPPAPLAPTPLAPIGTGIPTAPSVLFPAVVVPVTQPQPEPGVPPFALLPCGRKALLRGEKSRVELRDLTSGDVLTVWKWGLPRLHALAVAADGLTAAAAGFGGQVVIWDLG